MSQKFVMYSKCPIALFLTLLVLQSALVSCAPSVIPNMTMLQTNGLRDNAYAVAVVEVLGCPAFVRKVAGSKANFLLEPLLCWKAGMERHLCSGFDYLRSRHFLRVPVLLTDTAAPDQAKRLLSRLFPTSLQFMHIESVVFKLINTDQTGDIELEEQFGSAGGRNYLIVRVYCNSLDHCHDIRLGIVTQPSILFERIRLSLSSVANGTSSQQQVVRSVSSGSYACQSAQRPTLGGSSDRKGSRDSQDKSKALPEVAINKTRLVDFDGQLYFLVQQRSDGGVSFQRSWVEYENGFGSLSGDYWMGLRLLHSLTKMNRVLRVELVRFRGHSFHQDFFHAEYNDFRVGPPPLYALSYSALNKARSSVLGDALNECRGRSFSTMDRDNDIWPNSCSKLKGGSGGWWFSNCGASNPNGAFNGSNAGIEGAIRWGYLDSMMPNQSGEVLKSVRILLRV